LTVSDTGIGIPEKDHPRIFERFYRVDKARSRDLGGTGLGLAIVKHLVEGHGGQVWVEANHPQGSRFVVRLPIKGGKRFPAQWNQDGIV
jgi:two-component system phosphate regulon sensor histidine kinase PhoR